MAFEYEHRIQARIHPDHPIYVDYPDQRPQVRDLSLWGAYIEDLRPLARGRIFRLRFHLDEQNSITVKVMIRHVDEGVGMGVEFLEMSEDDRDHLRNFVGVTAGVDRLESL